jgi:hypothetical protein
MTAPTFDPAAFRAWLSSFPPDAVVASDWFSCSCPLAIWLREECGVFNPEVTPLGAPVWLECDEEHKLPRWAARFARRVDETKQGDDGRFGPITAAECLAVLDEVSEAAR